MIFFTQGDEIATLSGDTFLYNAKIRHIDVSDNTFTEIPSNLLEGLDALADFHVDNIAWTCTCANVWFVPHVLENNVTIHGDLRCSSGRY